MMDFPVVNDITRTPYLGETQDSLGNTTDSYGPPETIGRYTIAPHLVEQGSATSTETTVADVDVAMPKTTVNLKDQFIIDGDDYEVVGIQDWTKGFHGWTPGIVVELRRVT